MLPTRSGSLRLFQLFGISVYVHWSWLVAAGIMIHFRDRFSHPVLGPCVYLAVFAIVLLHEFGHSLACKSVGGNANQIVLWPLGGVAFVQPPPRPGAVLWSIAAGPLVNVLLIPVFVGLSPITGWMLGAQSAQTAQAVIDDIATLNLALLVFNMLPIYPLDGGQILQSLLWFVMGRPKSLQITAVLGLIFGILVGLVAFLKGQTFHFLIAAFIVIRCWSGFQSARAMARMEAHGFGHLVDERSRE